MENSVLVNVCIHERPGDRYFGVKLQPAVVFFTFKSAAVGTPSVQDPPRATSPAVPVFWPVLLWPDMAILLSDELRCWRKTNVRWKAKAMERE